ncbi:MAG: Druantia anti-phage system protein DruA [Gemmatimonadales bacterium]
MRLVHHEEQPRFQQLMQAHHYLGALRKIGETLWYVASWRAEWVALLSFSAAALKIAARDRWIGWSYRQQYARLKLLANNTRFCVLPSWQRPNVASRTLALCERRLAQDWREAFGHPILLLETFVDGQRHRGTLYQAANWSYVGDTRGYRRVPGGYSATAQSPKKIFVRPLHPKARTLLCQASLEIVAGTAGAKLMLTAQHLRALPQFFKDVPDPRRLAGRRHPLSTVLAIAAGAYLCGARGYKAMGAWAEQLSQSARQGLRCRCERNHYRVPSESIIRDVLLRVDRGDLERALQGWNTRFATSDASLVLQGQALLSVPALPEA